jgi:predicted Rossmann fold nucleotide-binding protein DprA/Smf involved in DNA uptake
LVTKIRELIEHFGSVQELLKTQPEMFFSKFKLSAKLAGLIAKATQTHSCLIEKRIIGGTPGIRLFCPDSSGYPLNLKQISTQPSVLYWQGNLEDAESPCLAFVGYRVCTA